MLVILFFVHLGSGSRYYKTCPLSNIDNEIEVVSLEKLNYEIELGSNQSIEIYNKPLQGAKQYFPAGYWLEEEQKFMISSRNFNFNTETSSIYLSYFDKNWKQIKTPSNFSSLTLPTIIPTHGGPEDQKMFRGPNNEFFVSFHKFDGKYRINSIFSLNNSVLNELTLDSYPVENGIVQRPKVEKNWSPVYTESKFFMVYSYNPFQLMDCTSKKICYHVAGNYKHDVGKIKPASQFERYKNSNFYFGFAWKHILMPTFRCYRPVFVMLYISPETSEYELIFISDYLYGFDKRLSKYKNKDQGQHPCFMIDLIMITSIAFFDPDTDTAILLGNFEDNLGFHTTIKGLDKIILREIYFYELKYYIYMSQN